ncbi:MAG: hypothetical protein FVQ80_15075 [Planctomycetes bacterium]|nr:hypothetical protein [Planctomycetota bacterium]
MTTRDSFPQNCIKGISIREGITEEGKAATPLYYFKNDNLRLDGWIEQSINWQDNEEVIAFTLSQRRKDDSIQFAYGVAILPTDELERLKNLPTVTPTLSYERAVLPTNPYHGNILLRSDVPKHRMIQIAASLALVSEVIQTNAINTS